MANVLISNKALEVKFESVLSTKVDMNNYLTIDNQLTQEAGMIKTVNVTSVTGSVEDLAMGAGNTATIEVTNTGVDYTVGTTQGRFVYYDEEAMKDGTVVDAGIKGLAEKMVNDLTAKAIAEFGKATLSQTYAKNGAPTFDTIVDAIAKLNTEDESGLFLMINPAQKAAFRKSLGDDLKYSEGFARTGYIGSVCGVPVIVSKAVTAGSLYLASKDAVTCFIKKGTEIETERDANLRKNTVYARKVMLVALTDATKVVEITEALA